MTKAISNRLNFEKSLDQYFDAGWKDFAEAMSKEVQRRNNRMLRAIASVKGQTFADAVFHKMDLAKSNSLLEIARQPCGYVFNEKLFPKQFEKIWVDSYSTPEGMATVVYIQIDKHRWIKFSTD